MLNTFQPPPPAPTTAPRLNESGTSSVANGSGPSLGQGEAGKSLDASAAVAEAAGGSSSGSLEPHLVAAIAVPCTVAGAALKCDTITTHMQLAG